MKKSLSVTFVFFLGFSLIPKSNSIDSLKRVLSGKLSDSVRADTYRLMAMSYYFDEGKLDSALSCIEKSRKSAPAKYIQLQSKIASNYGLLYREKGIYDKALEFYLKARKWAEKSKDTSLITNAVMGIAVLNTIQKDYPSAEKYYNEYYRLCDESKNELAKASYYNNMGLLYFHQEKYEKALDFYVKTLAIYEKFKDDRGFATTNENIGLLYAYNLNDFDKAVTNFKESLRIWRGMSDKHSEAITMGYMSFALIKKGNYRQAIDTCNVALSIAQEIGATSTERDLYDYLFMAYEKNGDFSKALSYYKKYIRFRDSLINDEKNSELTAMRVRFEENNKHAADSLEMAIANKLELEKKDEIIKQEAYFRYAMTGGLFLFLILGIVVFIAYRNKKIANRKIAEQKRNLEERNREITDSIQYAKYIQDSFLPNENSFNGEKIQGFVLYRPKDIVAGDFYWIEDLKTEKENAIMFAAADCTGHGVPGALVSVTCYHAINRAINEHGLRRADLILNKVNELVNESFSHSGKEINDGMDIAFCVYYPEQGELNYAGANNSIYIVHNNNLQELKPDKKPIGKFYNEQSFTSKTVKPEKGSMVYLFSDGFAHQFGGMSGKKYKYNRFREFLVSISSLSMNEQKIRLNDEFESWRNALDEKGVKRNFEQLDDVCVLGIRIL